MFIRIIQFDITFYAYHFLSRLSLSHLIEFMPGGSVYDYLHKQKGVFKLPTLFKVAIDICKGMSYLHQNNIIHRDLKAANLLMDENEVILATYYYISLSSMYTSTFVVGMYESTIYFGWNTAPC